MLIYFFTNQPVVCGKIADKLELAGYQCLVIENPKLFYHLLHSNDELPVLFVLDYTLIQHDSLNIYRYMKKIGRVAPLIFYNDPFPSEGVRANFWIYQTNLHFAEIDLSAIKTAFFVIANAVDSPELKKYIPLIQKPLKIGEDEKPVFSSQTTDYSEKDVAESKNQISENKKNGFNLYEFRKQMHMTPSIFNLFEYFYERKGESISVDELQSILLVRGTEAKSRSVSSYVCRLRKYLLAIKEINIDIIASNKSYKLVVF